MNRADFERFSWFEAVMIGPSSGFVFHNGAQEALIPCRIGKGFQFSSDRRFCPGLTLGAFLGDASKACSTSVPTLTISIPAGCAASIGLRKRSRMSRVSSGTQLLELSLLQAHR